MITELNEKNFDQVTTGEGIVLVDCWAPWCSNCDEFGEAYSRAAEKHPSHRFAALNTQAQKEVRMALDVRHVPALLVYREGLLLFKQAGSFDESALDDIVEQAESLDMDLVREEIAAAREITAA